MTAPVLARSRPTARVPVLVDDDGSAVWDTLAIVETLVERDVLGVEEPYRASRDG